jgi:DNA-directed RNA polymerase subunit N (RpoN/RPB10)
LGETKGEIFVKQTVLPEWRNTSLSLPWYPIFPDVEASTDTSLRISSVQLQSPGFWEFLGTLNALETFRKYLADRHERRKDRNWREPYEAEKAGLENEQLRTQVVKDQVDLLTKVGVPRHLIRRVVLTHVTRPLSTIDRFQDSGLIGGVLTNTRRRRRSPNLNNSTPDLMKRPTRMFNFEDDDEPKKK